MSRKPITEASSALVINEQVRKTIKHLAELIPLNVNYDVPFLELGVLEAEVVEGEHNNKMVIIKGGSYIFDNIETLYFQLDGNDEIKDFYATSISPEAKKFDGNTQIPQDYANLTIDETKLGEVFKPSSSQSVSKPKTIELIKERLQKDLAIVQNIMNFADQKDQELKVRFSAENAVKSSVVMKKDAGSDKLIIVFQTAKEQEAFLGSFDGTAKFVNNESSPFETDPSNPNVLLVRKASRSQNTAGYYPTMSNDFAVEFLNHGFSNTFCHLVPNFQDNGLSSYIPTASSKEEYQHYLDREHEFPILLEKSLLKEVKNHPKKSATGFLSGESLAVEVAKNLCTIS